MSASPSANNTFYLLTAIAGLASGMLFLALISGVSAMPVIGYFVQLPLFFVGFAFGLSSAGLASIGSLVIVLISAGFYVSLLFSITQLLPVLVVVRYAMWSRQNEKGKTEWFPSGMLLGRLVMTVLAVAGIMLVWTIWQSGSLANLFKNVLQEIEANFAGPGIPAGIAENLQPMMPFMPGMIACSWLLMVVINGVAGQWLATRQGQALRPTPQLRDMDLPFWVLPGFAFCALIGSIAAGNAQFIAIAGAMILSMPLLFQGLAVVHTLANRLTSPKLALSGFYIALLLFAWPLIFVVLGLGVIEIWAELRQKMAK